MDKMRLTKIFEEVLNNWRLAQECVIQNLGDFDETEFIELEKKINGYKEDFKKTLM